MDPGEAAGHVVKVVTEGGLALVPFDVAYAFLASSRAALEKIYKLKLRSPQKACPMLVSWEQFLQFADGSADEIGRVNKLVQSGLPFGVLTNAVWDCEFARSIPEDCLEYLVSGDRVGLFMNMGGMSDRILSLATEKGVRIFGSSANLSGMGNSFALEDVPGQIVESMDIICETGSCKYANPERLPSSIVDIKTGQLTRRGILHDEIERLLRG